MLGAGDVRRIFHAAWFQATTIIPKLGAITLRLALVNEYAIGQHRKLCRIECRAAGPAPPES